VYGQRIQDLETNKKGVSTVDEHLLSSTCVGGAGADFAFTSDIFHFHIRYELACDT
jgi:hypothetical protein